MHHRHGSPHGPQGAVAVFSLSLANPGETVRVHALPQGGKIQERLLSMGICQNDEITVLNKQPGGALMIQKNHTRYALGGGMAHKIKVVKV